MDAKLLDDLANRLSAALPQGLKVLQDDAAHTLRAALESAFARLDLVTRAEFDAQAQVLARTRALVEALSREVAELEARLGLGTPKSGQD